MPVLLLGGQLMSTSSDVAGFGILLVGACFMLPSVFGRLWALGLGGGASWDSAHLSLWRVTGHEVESDWEGFTSWFSLRLTPVDVPDGSRFARRGEDWLSVRMTPPSASDGGEWVGKALLMLERDDGATLVTPLGKHRFFRAGGDGPWDGCSTD